MFIAHSLGHIARVCVRVSVKWRELEISWPGIATLNIFSNVKHGVWMGCLLYVEFFLLSV